MKKITFLLVALLVLVSCEKETVDVVEEFDYNRMITIKAAPETRAMTYGLTPLEIVEGTMFMTFYTHYYYQTYEEQPLLTVRGFNEETQRDYDIPALKMFGTDVINEDGYIPLFTNAFDVYLIGWDRDTIGYVPNEILSEARVKIEKAYAEGDYEKVYELYDNAFMFMPLHAEE